MSLVLSPHMVQRSRMSHEQISSTDHHRNMEGVRSERLGNGPAFARRPPDRQTLGGSRAAALGLRALAGRAAQVYCTQTPQACAVGGGCRRSAKVEGSDWLLSGEASGLGPGSRAGGLGIDHSRYLQRVGLVRPSTKRRRPRFQNGQVMRPRNCPGLGYLQMDVKYVTPELSGLPYTCYLYAAMDISSRYKVGLILPKLDEGGTLLSLYYATQQFPFPLHYGRTMDWSFRDAFTPSAPSSALNTSIHKVLPMRTR